MIEQREYTFTPSDDQSANWAPAYDLAAEYLLKKHEVTMKKEVVVLKEGDELRYQPDVMGTRITLRW